MSEDKKTIDNKVEKAKELTEGELDQVTGGAIYTAPAKDVDQWKWDPLVVDARMR